MSTIYITVERLSAILRRHGMTPDTAYAAILDALGQTAPAIVDGVPTATARSAVDRRGTGTMPPLTGRALREGERRTTDDERVATVDGKTIDLREIWPMRRPA